MMTTEPNQVLTVEEQPLYELDQDDIRKILHYCHWIPAIRGISDLFFSNKYPEYGIKIVQVLIRAGALAHVRGFDGHFSGYRPKKRVAKVQLWPNGDAKIIWKTKTSR